MDSYGILDAEFLSIVQIEQKLEHQIMKNLSTIALLIGSMASAQDLSATATNLNRMEQSVDYSAAALKEKLALIQRLEESPLSEQFKAGLPELKAFVMNIFPLILPNLPFDSSEYGSILQKNYRTVKLTQVREWINRDIQMFLDGISYYWGDDQHVRAEIFSDLQANLHPVYYEKQSIQNLRNALSDPATQQNIIKAINSIKDQYTENSYTLMDYIEFLIKLVSASDPLIGDILAQNLEAKLAKFKDLTCDSRMIAVPLHTGDFKFSGIFGEGTIALGMVIGAFPIMYSPRPDVTADYVLFGPKSTLSHDIFEHFKDFTPEMYKALVDYLRQTPKIDDDVALGLFNIIHEGHIYSFFIQVTSQNLYPFYVYVANKILSIIRNHTLGLNELQDIDSGQFETIVSEIKNKKNVTFPREELETSNKSEADNNSLKSMFDGQQRTSILLSEILENYLEKTTRTNCNEIIFSKIFMEQSLRLFVNFYTDFYQYKFE